MKKLISFLPLLLSLFAGYEAHGDTFSFQVADQSYYDTWTADFNRGRMFLVYKYIDGNCANSYRDADGDGYYYGYQQSKLQEPIYQYEGSREDEVCIRNKAAVAWPSTETPNPKDIIYYGPYKVKNLWVRSSLWLPIVDVLNDEQYRQTFYGQFHVEQASNIEWVYETSKNLINVTSCTGVDALADSGRRSICQLLKPN